MWNEYWPHLMRSRRATPIRNVMVTRAPYARAPLMRRSRSAKGNTVVSLRAGDQQFFVSERAVQRRRARQDAVAPRLIASVVASSVYVMHGLGKRLWRAGGSLPCLGATGPRKEQMTCSFNENLDSSLPGRRADATDRPAALPPDDVRCSGIATGHILQAAQRPSPRAAAVQPARATRSH